MLLLSGTLHSVLTGIFLILEKVSRDSNGRNKSGSNNNNKSRDRDDDDGDEMVGQPGPGGGQLVRLRRGVERGGGRGRHGAGPQSGGAHLAPRTLRGGGLGGVAGHTLGTHAPPAPTTRRHPPPPSPPACAHRRSGSRCRAACAAC